jgi:replication factor A1
MKSIQVSVGPTPIHGTIDVKKTTVKFLGNLVAIQEGSGLIKRCKVDGCRRALSRQSYCPIHEFQKDFQYDMRIKGVVDMGDRVYNIHIPSEQVEKISSITLDKAIEIAENNPLGPEEVLVQLRDNLVGRYYKLEGSEFQDRVLVSSIYRASLNDIKQSTGLDFTKVQSTVEVG